MNTPFVKSISLLYLCAKIIVMKNVLVIMALSLAVLGVSCGGSSDSGTSTTKSYAEIREEEPNYMGDSTIYDGILLSHENNVKDWDKVAQDSLVQFVYLKATDGASVQDSKYKKSLKAARKAGLKVGSAHYFRMTSKPEDQFKNFKKTVKVDDQDLIPAVYAECEFKRSSKEEFSAALKSFLDKVEEYCGVKPIICCSVGVYHKRLKKDFADYMFWMSNPTIPSTAKYTLWQTDSYVGHIDGIDGGVDISTFNDSCGIENLIINK